MRILTVSCADAWPRRDFSHRPHRHARSSHRYLATLCSATSSPTRQRRASCPPAGRSRWVPARSPPMAPTLAPHFGSCTGCCPPTPMPDRSRCSASAHVETSSPTPWPLLAYTETDRGIKHQRLLLPLSGAAWDEDGGGLGDGDGRGQSSGSRWAKVVVMVRSWLSGPAGRSPLGRGSVVASARWALGQCGRVAGRC